MRSAEYELKVTPVMFRAKLSREVQPLTGFFDWKLTITSKAVFVLLSGFQLRSTNLTYSDHKSKISMLAKVFWPRTWSTGLAMWIGTVFLANEADFRLDDPRISVQPSWFYTRCSDLFWNFCPRLNRHHKEAWFALEAAWWSTPSGDVFRASLFPKFSIFGQVFKRTVFDWCVPLTADVATLLLTWWRFPFALVGVSA